MKSILVFGLLPSGFGGMETVFVKFAEKINQQGHYSVSFYLYGLGTEIDHNWLRNIDYRLYRPTSQFRLFQKVAIKNDFALYVKEKKPSLIIAFDPLGVMLAKKALIKVNLTIPLLSWLHFPIIQFKPKHQRYIIQADYHLSLCEGMTALLIERRVASETIFTIYNPIERKSEPILRPKGDISTFLYVGRVQYNKQKNIQELFQALAYLNKPFRLDIVGDGSVDDVEKLKQLAIKLGISEYIRWHGWQRHPWQYVKRSIKEVSAFVLTSLFEGLPMALCEALSYGIFCISSDCKTGPSDVINGINGMLYRSTDIQQLTNCLGKIYSHDQLPSYSVIKQSIEFVYDDQYIRYLDKIFSLILGEKVKNASRMMSNLHV